MSTEVQTAFFACAKNNHTPLLLKLLVKETKFLFVVMQSMFAFQQVSE